MKDPWESDASSQKIPEELNPVIPKSESGFKLEGSPKATAFKQKQQPKQDTVFEKPPKPELIPITQGHTAEFTSSLQLNRENLIQGVIWAEVLGKPKAKRGQF